MYTVNCTVNRMNNSISTISLAHINDIAFEGSKVLKKKF